jgi:hypothetical protein
MSDQDHDPPNFIGVKGTEWRAYEVINRKLRDQHMPDTSVWRLVEGAARTNAIIHSGSIVFAHPDMNEVSAFLVAMTLAKWPDGPPEQGGGE